jgi:hypothetical protein
MAVDPCNLLGSSSGAAQGNRTLDLLITSEKMQVLGPCNEAGLPVSVRPIRLDACYFAFTMARVMAIGRTRPPKLTGGTEMASTSNHVTKAPKVDEAGLAVARRYARWHLGDPAWANRIIRAYLNPEEAQALLDAETND